MKSSAKFNLKNKSIRELIEERKALSKKFIDLYGDSVLIHATHDKKTFLKILKDGKLKIPANHNSEKKVPYMERFINIDNCIYFSLGFNYATDFNFRYNFLFSLECLKECVYFNGSLTANCYKDIMKFWDENDKKYVEKLRKYSPLAKEVVEEYYTREIDGKKKVVFRFYKIEDVLFKFIEDYPQKKKLLKIIEKKRKEYEILYPKSLKFARDAYLSDGAPEALCFKDLNLVNNKYFAGFYIKGSIPADVKKIIKNKFKDKILFDGKKIKVID